MISKKNLKNPLYQCIILPFNELLGAEQAHALLNKAGIHEEDMENDRISMRPAEMIEQIGRQAMSEFGEQSTRGLLIRAGRGSLIFLRQNFSELESLGSLENRLTPVDQRFFHALDELAAFCGREVHIACEVERADKYEYTWRMNPEDDFEMGHFIPYLLFGLLEEFCTWLDARKEYQIIYAEPERGEHPVITLAIQHSV